MIKMIFPFHEVSIKETNALAINSIKDILVFLSLNLFAADR